jgi:nucleotide-binding universal stress UspA family protein
MKTIVVALDNSLAGKALIAAAKALALLLNADLEAVHIQVDGDQTARNSAEAAGIPLRVLTGEVVEQLVEAGTAGGVIALAIGARGTAHSRRPLGSTAEAVATALSKPVLITAPDGAPSASIQRVLVPLEGTLSSSLAPRAIFELAGDAQLDVVALHVHDQDSIPAFTDQPQHERPAWTREFLHRYLPAGLGKVELETRVGRTGELIPEIAEEHDCDLIALGWSQELAPGRAPVVRETLTRTRRPVLLVPVQLAAAADIAMSSAGAGSSRRAAE